MAGVSAGDDRLQGRKNQAFRRPKRRMAVRIDMTPMVDIAFLLLIFYMVTTVFALPQAIEIDLPPPADIRVHSVLTIHVDQQNRFYWSMNLDLPIQLKPDSLRTLLISQNRANPLLNTRIIIHEKARFHTMVDILDAIEMTEHMLNTAIAEHLGVTLMDLNDPANSRYDEFKEKRFSYRYAMSSWQDRDSRMIAKAQSKEGRE
jgi:biopolymer transport protein ExbD